MSVIRIILADDHPIVREGIRRLLKDAADIAVVGEAENGRSAIELVEALSPDVLVLDMEMPVMNGIDVAEEIQKEKLPVRILALSAYDDRQYIREALNHGITGYILKEEAPAVIIDAVRGVSRGENCWISRKALVHIVPTSQKSEPEGFMGLTKRELQVLKVLTGGKTNQEIGRTLGISEKTVERHLQVVFSKLGVVSRVEAAVMIVRAGIEE